MFHKRSRHTNQCVTYIKLANFNIDKLFKTFVTLSNKNNYLFILRLAIMIRLQLRHRVNDQYGSLIVLDIRCRSWPITAGGFSCWVVLPTAQMKYCGF